MEFSYLQKIYTFTKLSLLVYLSINILIGILKKRAIESCEFIYRIFQNENPYSQGIFFSIVSCDLYIFSFSPYSFEYYVSNFGLCTYTHLPAIRCASISSGRERSRNRHLFAWHHTRESSEGLWRKITNRNIANRRLGMMAVVNPD